MANSEFPAEFIYENLMIEANVIHRAWRQEVQDLLYFGSTCMYPRLCAQPMREEELVTGTLEPTNEPYALAKLAGWKLCESYNRQYRTRYRTYLPTNLYGPHDNFHPEHRSRHPCSATSVPSGKAGRTASGDDLGQWRSSARVLVCG